LEVRLAGERERERERERDCRKIQKSWKRPRRKWKIIHKSG